MAINWNVDNSRVDPDWPEYDGEGDMPVSELASDRQGAQSPYGDLAFPLDSVDYEHPHTEINRR